MDIVGESRSTSGLDECEGITGDVGDAEGPRIDITSASIKLKIGLLLSTLTFCDLSAETDGSHTKTNVAV